MFKNIHEYLLLLLLSVEITVIVNLDNAEFIGGIIDQYAVKFGA